MHARRSSLLAASATLALLATTVTGANAADATSSDDTYSVSVSRTELTEARGTAESATAPAAADATLEAVSGPAAVIRDLVNQRRANAGLYGVIENETMNGLAAHWSRVQRDHGTYENNENLGDELPGWPISIGQLVIAHNYDDAAELFADLMTDPEIAEIVLTQEFTHAGFGWATDAQGDHYLTVYFAEYDFRDVPGDHPVYEDIIWLVDAGVTTGYDDRTYRPTAGVSRQAMSAFLYRWVTGSDEDPTCDPATERLFTDVGAASPFCGVIEWLAENEIAGGYADGSFRPTAPVTRQATAAFLYRLFHEDPVPAACTEAPFGDVGTGSEFCGHISWLASTGITQGFSDNTFRPANTVSRQAMASFLRRAAQVD